MHIVRVVITPRRNLAVCFFLSMAAFCTVYLTTTHPANFYDYSLRIGEAMLGGHLGMKEEPPSWLNEMVPLDGSYYSVFPLGNILSIMPFAIIKKAGWMEDLPSRLIAAVLAASITLLAFLLSGPYKLPLRRRALLAVAPFFGTCLWANVAYGGSWQIAIGIAVAAEFAALHFLLVRRRPALAGFFFAVAFGNRTEIILTAPVLYWFLTRESATSPGEPRSPARDVLAFSWAPLLLGVLTLWYNEARFSNPFDFGYARIPGVLLEPWYRHGIFSLHAIPGNLWVMFLQPWKALPGFPWLVPTGWGGSVFLYSPFLLMLFAPGAFRGVKAAAWTGILLLLVVLCLHGNPGGWQVSSRYAMILLPWAFLIILENHASRGFALEGWLIGCSVLINAWAAWLFCATEYMQP